MKIKKIAIKHSMLLKLKLIKTKMYLKKERLPNVTIEDVECRLKKGLQVISKYHAKKKKILFVGNLSFVEEAVVKKLLKNTRHVFVPEYLWINGHLLNKKASPLSFSKRGLVRETPQLRHNNHLTILFNGSASDIIVENYKAKIPTIVLSNNLNIFDVTFSYKILGNFIMSNEKIKSHLFVILMQSFLTQFMKALVLIKKRRSLRKKRRNLKPSDKNLKPSNKNLKLPNNKFRQL